MLTTWRRRGLRPVLGMALLVTALFLMQQSAIAGQTTVQVGDIWFCDETFQGGACETTINVGETVVWDSDGAGLPHTTTECGASCDEPTDSPIWDSGLMGDGSTFEYTFNEPGTFLYFCQVHPTLQRGIITVQGEGAVGDVNCSGNVDAIDAALILQITAGLIGSLQCGENADANEDGTTNAIDAALILQLTAGLVETLPP